VKSPRAFDFIEVHLLVRSGAKYSNTASARAPAMGSVRKSAAVNMIAGAITRRTTLPRASSVKRSPGVPAAELTGCGQTISISARSG